MEVTGTGNPNLIRFTLTLQPFAGSTVDVVRRWTRAEEARVQALPDILEAGSSNAQETLPQYIADTNKLAGCRLVCLDEVIVEEPAQIMEETLQGLDVALAAFVYVSLMRAPRERRNLGFLLSKRSEPTSA